MNELAGSC